MSLTHKGKTHMARHAKLETGRREFLKLAAGAAGAAAAVGPWISRNAQAKPSTIVFARESSYVKNFDEHFQKVLIPASSNQSLR